MNMPSKTQLLLIRGCLLATLIVLCGWYRWSKELHYRELFVRISGASSLAAKAELFAVRPGGRLTALNRVPTVEGLWIFQGSGPISGIVAAWVDETAIAGLSFEIRSGGSWTDDAVTLQSQVVRQVEPGDVVLRAELDRRGRAGAAVVFPEAYAGSVWSENRDVVNWGGDGYFLAVVVMQALLFGILAEWFLNGLLAATVSWLGQRRSDGREPIFRIALFQSVRAVALVVFAIQFVMAIEQLLGMRDAVQYLVGASIAGLLGLLYWGWLHWISRSASPRRLLRGMLGVGGVILCLKLLWLQTVDATPCSDYAQYHKLGQQLAAGAWDSMGPKDVPLTHLLMRRSWCFSFPIMVLFGGEISTFEYCNAACQILSAALMSWLVHRIWGLQTAARFLPLVLFVPEFWYSAGIVSHNVWGYLWIPLVWLLVDMFLVWTERVAGSEQRRWLIHSAWALLCGAVAGICVGMVDLLKHYGPFFLLAISSVVLVRQRVNQQSDQMRDNTAGAGLMLRILFLITVIVTSTGFWSRVDSFLRSRSGVAPATFTTTMARLASTETGSPAIATSFTIWTNQFFLRLPTDMRLPLQVRKALHEHVASGLRLWKQYWFKAQLMAVQTNAMTIVQDEVSEANEEHSIRLVPWSTVQVTIAWLLSATFLSAGILRLLALSAIPVNSRELLPVLSVVFVMTAAFALTDAHPYTGQNLAFPLCCTMAILPGYGGQLALRNTSADWRGVLAMLQIPKLLLGFAAFGCLIAAHVGLGMVVDHSGLAFHRVVAVSRDSAAKDEQEETVNIDPQGVRLIGSRIHAGFCLAPLNRHVSEGMRVVRHFRVTANRGKLEGLRFLVTGNPREFLHGGYANRSVVLRNAWKDLPIRYRMAIEGKEVDSGRLEDLARVRPAGFTAESWRGQKPPGSSGSAENSVLITLSMESDADADLANLPWPPSIAIECIF